MKWCETLKEDGLRQGWLSYITPVLHCSYLIFNLCLCTHDMFYYFTHFYLRCLKSVSANSVMYIASFSKGYLMRYLSINFSLKKNDNLQQSCIVDINLFKQNIITLISYSREAPRLDLVWQHLFLSHCWRTMTWEAWVYTCFLLLLLF